MTAQDIKGKKGSFPAHRSMHMQCNIQKTIMRMCGLRCCALRKPGMRYVCAGCKGKEKRRGARGKACSAKERNRRGARGKLCSAQATAYLGNNDTEDASKVVRDAVRTRPCMYTARREAAEDTEKREIVDRRTYGHMHMHMTCACTCVRERTSGCANNFERR